MTLPFRQDWKNTIRHHQLFKVNEMIYNANNKCGAVSDVEFCRDPSVKSFIISLQFVLYRRMFCQRGFIVADIFSEPN